MKEEYEMKEEHLISMRQEQVLLCPQSRKSRGSVRETAKDEKEAQEKKMEKLMDLLRELAGNKFFGKLLIKYESGHIVLVKKMQYIRFSAP